MFRQTKIQICSDTAKKTANSFSFFKFYSIKSPFSWSSYVCKLY